MASRWGSNGTVTDFILGGSKITVDGDCSHEIKRHFLLGRKVITNLDSILNKQRHYFAKKCPSSQNYGFSSTHMYGCESWTVRKLSTKELMLLNCGVGEDLRVPWTEMRSNQSILKEISPEYSLKGLMLEAETPILWPPDAKN